MGGLTSIDITRRGIDKSYAILRMQKYFRIKKDEMVFIGDAVYPGGNDYPVTKTGIPYLKVKCPTETRSVIERLLGV
jgi:hydroxymethylpyrimidine pyrophosphatase-like HAD family hydrolase